MAAAGRFMAATHHPELRTLLTFRVANWDVALRIEKIRPRCELRPKRVVKWTASPSPPSNNWKCSLMFISWSLSRWWFQPIWTICSSNWIISPQNRDENKKHLSCHHLVIGFLYIVKSSCLSLWSLWANIPTYIWFSALFLRHQRSKNAYMELLFVGGAVIAWANFHHHSDSSIYVIGSYK